MKSCKALLRRSRPPSPECQMDVHWGLEVNLVDTGRTMNKLLYPSREGAVQPGCLQMTALRKGKITWPEETSHQEVWHLGKGWRTAGLEYSR